MTIATRSLSDAEIRSLAARLDRPLVLVGMMGVGKSTVGRKLAQLLAMPFADADEEIEVATVPVDEVYDWARSGRITHSLVLNGLLLFAPVWERIKASR